MPQPGNPGGLNRYSYGSNNPVKYTDPTGHCSENGDEECWGVYEQIIGACPECANLEWYGTGGSLYEANIRYLQVVLKSVQAGWRPPEQQSFIEYLANALVPDSGTVSFGISVMGGAGLMGSASFAILHIDSEGNVVLFSPSLGGGGLAGGAGEATLFLMSTNAKNVEHLEGWYVNVGVGADLGPAVGFDMLWFKDYETGEEFIGKSLAIGAGISVAPLPGAEVHGGFGYTWMTPLKFNMYDAMSVTRPITR